MKEIVEGIFLGIVGFVVILVFSFGVLGLVEWFFKIT